MVDFEKLARYYNLQSILGYDWAMFFVLMGLRSTGKTTAVQNQLINDWEKYGPDKCKNYWFRLSDTSVKAMTQNKAAGFLDPLLYDWHDLEITTKGRFIFNHGKVFCECMPLVSMGKLKGVSFFDANFMANGGHINVVLDEFCIENGEKSPSFNILYNFIGMVENTCRTSKNNVHIYLMANNTEECSTILSAFDFIPEKPGRFPLKRKRCVIDNIPVNKAYITDRDGSAADLLGGKNQANFAQKLEKDIKLINRSRLKQPNTIIKFQKTDEWYTIWENNTIKRYNKETLKNVISMRPYIDNVFSPELRQNIIDMFDAEAFKFDTLITKKYFQESLKSVRKAY